MTLLVVSIIAGMLTVLAPCILPLLPVVLGGTAADVTDKRRPIRIVFWLSLSVFVFTFLLRASTILIDIPQRFWSYFAAFIIGFFGLTLLFPSLWENLSAPLQKIEIFSNKALAEGSKKKSVWGDIIMALALGPIFTTCSPTYFVILAAVLPESLSKGVIYISAYIVGLAFSLLVIAYAGQKILLKLNVAADPRGRFKRTLGLLFIVLAILIGSGLDKKIETAILDGGFFDVTKVEQTISEKLIDDGDGETEEPLKESAPTEETSGDVSQDVSVQQGQRTPQGPQYAEIVRPSGFVNSEPFELKDIVGEKVILLDFMTYSCINCQRTFPYLNEWYEKYKDEGLEIVGIHTPEFAFEKKIENVEDAAQKFGLEFPLVLDNNYTTWTAYENRFWPRKYLINIYGEIVYDHIGEGKYEETEARIVELLNERKEVIGEAGNVSKTESGIVSGKNVAKSPETYFGAWRNSAFFGNGTPGAIYEKDFSYPVLTLKNNFYLDGTWAIEKEYIVNKEAGASLRYRFDAKDVFMVAESVEGAVIEVYIDGKKIDPSLSGDEIGGNLNITGSQLFHVYKGGKGEVRELELKVIEGEAKLYTFTFG